jgi:hypothetical protein
MPFTTQDAWQRREKLDLRTYLEHAIEYLKAIERAVDLQTSLYVASAPYCDVNRQSMGP